MATFTGSVAGFEALKAAIETTLVARGWTLTDGILSRGVACVRLTATASELRLQAGTGHTAAVLVDACPYAVKMMTFANAPIVWPAVYTLHVFDAPDEVYVVLRYNVDRYQHLNFGVSNMPQIGGSGLWCSASFRGDVDGARATTKVYLSGNSGTDVGAVPYDGMGLGYFFASLGGTYHSAFLHCGLEAPVAWRMSGSSGAAGELLGVSHKAGLLYALPSQFNQATVLLPIDVLMARQAQGQSLVASLAHARYCRLDHLDLSEPLVYGPERWTPYPLHAVHPVQRNGVNWPFGAQHSGTYGVAIRDEVA